MKLDRDLLKAILHYDPATGAFRWKVGLSSATRIGDIAGTVSGNGIYQIRLFRKTYASGTLAWLYMTGRWPRVIVDHKDRNPLNNKWSNLRLATIRQNLCNRRQERGAGERGTQYRPDMGKWTAKITINRKQIALGTFDTTEAAGVAYREASRKYHGEFAFTG